MNGVKRLAPWILVAVLSAWVIGSLFPPRPKEFHTADFGRLPVLLNGRAQPLDSVARNSLLVIRTKQSVPVEKGPSLSAIDWLTEVMMKPEVANTRKIFRIDHGELLDLLALPHHDKYYSFEQLITPKPGVENAAGAKTRLGDLQREYDRVRQKDDKLRNVYEKAVMKLATSLQLYDRLKNSIKPENVTNYLAEIEAYQKSIGPGMAAVEAREASKQFDEAALQQMARFVKHYEMISRLAYPLLIPPNAPQPAHQGWENVGTSLLNSLRSGEINPVLRKYAEICMAYRAGNAAQFNQKVAEYRGWLVEHKFNSDLKKGQGEFFFNRFEPFYKALILYVLAGVIACISWMNLSELLRRSAFGVMSVALAVHTFGLIFRMVLEGRPPVTNLYSSAIFIGWGAAVLGLILERFFRDGIGTVTASALGFVTLLIAHHLALISPTGDTMEMLRAVLDTNFWLATHVVTITLGYSATFMAGFLAILYIVRGVFTRSLSEPMADALSRMVYGIVCFATLFSFIGTVLGGIWADQSWGRFWGWDPKENGALLIVLWCAAILHARWGGMIKDRGLMNMAIFGNIITSFSWFGVNMLGVGLHSYGFMDSALLWLTLFILSQLFFIGLGCLPESMWRSFARPLPPKENTSQPPSLPPSAREIRTPAAGPRV